MKYWKRLRRKNCRPIETIIIAMSPVPRLRSGRHSPESCSQPKATPSTTAITAANANGQWNTVLNVKAISAPKVTSSPCAKLVSPVVPKIIDSPSAAIAMMIPKRSPL